MPSLSLVAFDLDYTLWDLWIDTHVTGPLRRDGNAVFDRYNNVIAFYKDVPEIFHRLKQSNISITACSRTSAPKLAKQALRLILVQAPQGDAKPAIEFFDELEIYPGSKITHFKQLHEKTGIPYSEMLFFDDEHRNKEVEKLGVTFQLVPDTGLTKKVFEQGLALWKQRHPADTSN